MPIIELKTEIDAPIERVFDLARSIDFHQNSLEHTREKAVDGVTSGLIELDQTVTWEATHFGVVQTLTSKITVCDRPNHLQDIMVSGAFEGFVHDHYFSNDQNITIMQDIFDYKSPFGFVGRVFDSVFLEGYMRRLLLGRNHSIKAVAEGDTWQQFLQSSGDTV